MSDDLEQPGDRIAEQSAHLDAAMHCLLTDLREFDKRGGWSIQGARSFAHWLSWRVGWDLVMARDRVRIAGKLGALPLIDDALRRGELSYSKVRAMTRVATPANEPLLLEYAQFMTASQLENACRKLALVQRNGEAPKPRDDQQRRYVRRRDAEDGMVKLEAVLHPDEAELVWTMLNHAAAELARQPPPACNDSAESHLSAPVPVAPVSPPSDVAALEFHDSAESGTTGPASAHATSHHFDDSAESREAVRGSDEPGDASGGGEPMSRGGSALQRHADEVRRAFDRADGLVAIAQGYLRGDRPERSPVEITVAIPLSSLREGAGDPVDVGEMGESLISSAAARRLSCDGGLVEVVEDEKGVPLSVGRKRRTITGALKRALRARDTMCTFPGCTNRLFLEGHHIKHWVDGGETSLANTALLCSIHHRHVHEYGYSIELGPDQRPRFRDPRGRVVQAVPERPAPAGLGWPSIRAMNEPLTIDANTNACRWDGRPVDYRPIIGYLIATEDAR